MNGCRSFIRFSKKVTVALHVYHEEGFENSEWILLDYIDVVVHIFLTEKRDFYKLEDLWADAERKNYED